MADTEERGKGVVVAGEVSMTLDYTEPSTEYTIHNATVHVSIQEPASLEEELATAKRRVRELQRELANRRTFPPYLTK